MDPDCSDFKPPEKHILAVLLTAATVFFPPSFLLLLLFFCSSKGKYPSIMSGQGKVLALTAMPVIERVEGAKNKSWLISAE